MEKESELADDETTGGGKSRKYKSKRSSGEC
jgi:hypothetical protein